MTDTATLQARLTEAEEALHQLLTGTKAIEVQTDMGTRVRYSNFASSTNALRRYIDELKAKLGQKTGRQAIRIGF